MPFGISTSTITGITAIIAANSSVSRIVLFGSRAKGNPKPGSDIDIAVSGPGLSLQDFLDFSLQIDRMELAQKVDIIDFQKINDNDLIEHIRRIGVVLFENKLFRKYGLPPVIDDLSKILVLGSFPSEVSLEYKRYYANSRNSFWKVMLSALNEPFTGDYQQHLSVMEKHHIALWDVLESCIRDGSKDSGITYDRPNDLKELLQSYPNLTHLVFNGNNPVRYFIKHGLNEENLVFVPSFPSSSSLNTSLTLNEKIDRWKSIRYIPGFH